MAEDKSQEQQAGGEDVEELASEAAGDTLKVPSESEDDPKLQNVEGSESGS